jgi:tetratricopeptide (TPR) repeat protein
LRRSIEHFRRAIEKDPEYALAWTGLADTYIMVRIFGLEPPSEAMTRAQAAAQRALMLDGSLSEAHTVLAEVQKLYEWDWAAAERSYLRAIELDENYAVAHHWYAQLLSIVGRHDEAQRQIEMARRCDPVSPTIAAFVSYVALEARRVEAAIAAANDALELDANAPITHYLLGRAYAIAGDMSGAIATLRTALKLGGWVPFIEACLGYAYARADDRPRAEQILARLRTRALTGYVSPIDLAQIYLGLHDRDAAMAQLEKAYRTRAVRTVIIGDPFFSELVSDARYRELMSLLRPAPP